MTLVLGHGPERVGTDIAAWQALVHPEDMPGIAEAARAAVTGDTHAWSASIRLRRADGTYAPVRMRAVAVGDASGATRHIVGGISDVSEIGKLEAEVREANERLAAELARERQERIRAELLMRVPTSDVLWEWWLDDDRIVWSPNVETVLGHPSSTLATVADVAARSPDIANDIAATRERVVGGLTQAWSRRFRWALPSGEALELEAHAYVLRDAHGIPARVIGSMRRVVPAEETQSDLDLTARQRQVLSLVRLGHTNKEIAVALGIGEQAAKVQVSKLLRRFRVSNRAALAVAGRRHAAR